MKKLPELQLNDVTGSASSPPAPSRKRRRDVSASADAKKKTKVKTEDVQDVQEPCDESEEVW
jgi:hypothetical protein